jgi:tRNA (guanine9-N1)-methyltransferase
LQFSDITPNTSLVIGGLVDRNRHKNITKDKADALLIKTAKLPITLPMNYSQVLTVNQVFEILVLAYLKKDWEESVNCVIPDRKKKAT